MLLYRAFAEYNRDQCIATKIENSEKACLITDGNDLNDGRFYDPRTKQSFKYIFPSFRNIRLHEIHWFRFDHLRREASEYEPYEPDEQAEPWRAALEKQLNDYIRERYQYGACLVVGASNDDRITLSAYIESHKFEAKNFW